MNFRYVPRKSIIFKIIYLVFTVAVSIFTAYLLIADIVRGCRVGMMFDDIIVLITLLISLLFEASIAGFIIRSFKQPTLLMKNLVFKWDGTTYLIGIVSVAISTVISFALTIVMFLSAFFFHLLNIVATAEELIFDILLIVCTNLSFTTAYFFTFRHESGSIAVI